MEYHCDYCKRTFRTNSALRRHKHAKRFCSIKNFLCHRCGSYYTSLISLRTHESMYCKKKKVQSLLVSFVTNWLAAIPENVTFIDKTSFIDYIQVKSTYDTFVHHHALLKDGYEGKERELISMLLYLYSQQQITLSNLIDILVLL